MTKTIGLVRIARPIMNLLNSKKFRARGYKLISLTEKFEPKYNFVTGHAILSKLIGVVNKTIKKEKIIYFFLRNFFGLSYV